MVLTYARSQEETFRQLEDYTANRRSLADDAASAGEQGGGLPKSYVLETAAGQDSRLNVPQALRETGWQLQQVGADDFYAVGDGSIHYGYVEPLTSRHLVLHSTMRGQLADRLVQKAVNRSASLDNLWLASQMFSTLWQYLIRPTMPDRYVRLQFEYLDRFERGWPEVDGSRNNYVPATDAVIERRSSTMTFTERAARLGDILPGLQQQYDPFNAIEMLRMPAAGLRGGYEFWSWGKVTYRARSFLQGRNELLSVVRIYEQVTREIERQVWFAATTERGADYEGTRVQGATVTLRFSQPLRPTTFDNLIATTFERGEGPLRLWGNPIRLAGPKVHIYGLDRHLWQKLYLELTPQQITAVLPHGTCGNTVHRLLTNIQRYVDPAVQMWVGEMEYGELLRRTLLGQLEERG